MSAIQKLNDLRSRVLRASELRALGRYDEANAMDPTNEEIRQGLIQLRTERGEATRTSDEKKAKAQAAAPLNLNDLFSKEI